MYGTGYATEIVAEIMAVTPENLELAPRHIVEVGENATTVREGRVQSLVSAAGSTQLRTQRLDGRRIMRHEGLVVARRLWEFVGSNLCESLMINFGYHCW
jgi:hypothetical protein